MVGDVCDRVVMTTHEVRILEKVGAVGHVERAGGLVGLVELPLCILDGGGSVVVYEALGTLLELNRLIEEVLGRLVSTMVVHLITLANLTPL